MKDLIGGPGTVSGLLLRIGQSAGAAASIGVMVTAHGFSIFTAFWWNSVSWMNSWMGQLLQFVCFFFIIGLWLLLQLYDPLSYLIASMGLQLLWSFGLGCLDIYALRKKRDLRSPVLVSLFVVGDWVTATLSLAASCASAGIAVLYARDMDFCKGPMNSPCRGFQVSVGLAFVTWSLIATSSHVMFWILASV